MDRPIKQPWVVADEFSRSTGIPPDQIRSVRVEYENGEHEIRSPHTGEVFHNYEAEKN